MIKTIIKCNECRSEFYQGTSKMSNLCPDCSFHLYNYSNCVHEFVNQRCTKCYWNGLTSDYIKSLNSKEVEIFEPTIRRDKFINKILDLNNREGFTFTVFIKFIYKELSEKGVNKYDSFIKLCDKFNIYYKGYLSENNKYIIKIYANGYDWYIITLPNKKHDISIELAKQMYELLMVQYKNKMIINNVKKEN